MLTAMVETFIFLSFLLLLLLLRSFFLSSSSSSSSSSYSSHDTIIKAYIRVIVSQDVSLILYVNEERIKRITEAASI